MNMRILHVVNAYKPAYKMGGTVFTSMEVAQRQAAMGHQVTVFTTTCNSDEELDVPTDCPHNVDGVTVWYFRRREYLKEILPFVPYISQSTGFLYAPTLRRQLRRTLPQTDIVHTHTPFVYTTYAACTEARAANRPVVYQAHGSLDPGRMKFRSLKKNLYLSLIERRLMQQASVLVALTDSEARTYKNLGVDTDCAVLPNGVSVSNYETGHKRIATSKFGIPAGSQVVLFMSRLHPQKGASRLVEAFLAIAHQHPYAVLVLAGPDECGLQFQYESRVTNAGLAGRVIFAGMVNGDLKRDLLARADLFCLPSDGEGFSVAILEALASGTSVLISPGCHFSEVEHAGVGVVVEPTVNELAARMTSLLTDGQRLADMGYNARVFVTRQYAWEGIVDRLLTVYKAAISAHDRGVPWSSDAYSNASTMVGQ